MQRTTYWLLAAALIALLVLTGMPATPGTAQTPVPSAPPVLIGSEIAAEPPSLAVAAALESVLTRVYEEVSPSVVAIQTLAEVTPRNGPSDTSFIVPQGSGSGFVVDDLGHIVTNYHVIAQADQIEVTFLDGTIVRAELIGSAPDSDLAVLRVDLPAESLQPVRLADSSRVKIGQLTIAIGNPFGLSGTMTTGVVSALGRLLPPERDGGASGRVFSIPNVIQTDAPINPGNSGGVLVDRQGQVIGVNTAIISSGGASAGIGFAVPSNMLRKILPSLIETGRYEHPWLGVSGATLSPDLTEAMALPAGLKGAAVIAVEPDGPADKAGLRGSEELTTVNGRRVPVDGDVITAIDGLRVRSFDDVISYLAANKEVGQEVVLTVLREGVEQAIPVTLLPRPGNGQ